MNSDKHIRWKKGKKLQLTKHFSSTEFDCKCNYPECVDQALSADLLKRLEDVRIKYGGAIKVTSALRCAKYQQHLRGSGIKTAVGVSQHELGGAVDVKADNMTKLLVLLEDEFNAIGIAKTFYHVDIRDDKTRRWDY